MPEVHGRQFDWVRSLDPRNAEHRLTALFPTHVPRKTRLWRGPYLRIDQGPDGACVGFGWTNEAMSMPVIVRPQPYTLPGANAWAFARYRRAQQLDEFKDTPPADGSSVNGGAKAMRELGLISGWKWAENVDDIIDALIIDGPVVVGTDWLEGMFDPGEHNILSVSGQVAGGHCYCLTGFHTRYYGAPSFRMRQSWGGSWGDNGDAWIRVSDFQRLMDDGGEAAQAQGRTYLS